jgi:hypothetical protein
MAYDLIFKNTTRNWSRNSVLGYDPSCKATSPPPTVQEKSGPSIIGWSIGIMFGSRIITGKWPWYWFRKIDHRL